MTQKAHPRDHTEQRRQLGLNTHEAGTEMSVSLKAQKTVANRKTRQRKRRGAPVAVSQTDSERVLRHTSGRTGKKTVEVQVLNEAGDWARASVAPDWTPTNCASLRHNKRELATMGAATPPLNLTTNAAYDARRAAGLPVIVGHAANYEQRATALGFATQGTLDRVGPGHAVFGTWLCAAILMGEKQDIDPLKLLEEAARKIESRHPNALLWMAGGSETIIHTLTPRVERFIKDDVLGLTWTGSKDAHRHQKKKADETPWPRSMRRKMESLERKGELVWWLVPHLHFVLVVFDSEGRPLPAEEVMSALETLPTARQQMHTEQVGDDIGGPAMTDGEHALTICEYLIKQPPMAATIANFHLQQWRASAPNSGLFDLLIDTRKLVRFRSDAGPVSNGIWEDFQRVRSNSHAVCGLANHHISHAGSIADNMKFLRTQTRTVTLIRSESSWFRHVQLSWRNLTNMVQRFYPKIRGIFGKHAKDNTPRPP